MTLDYHNTSVEKFPFKTAVCEMPHLGSEPEQAKGKLGFEEKKGSSGEDVICLGRSSMTPEGFLASVSHLHAEEEKDSEKKRETLSISQSYRFNESPTNPHHPLTTPYTHTH
ncbi:hypothetical protein QQF64_016002 [Cirrhinus molitorella]|uniref:Uncharacterized protein n=1 Tax=Cirrhinus molitorella TaxID=172907 RepID=A0ABR3LQM9_9TELE